MCGNEVSGACRDRCVSWPLPPSHQREAIADTGFGLFCRVVVVLFGADVGGEVGGGGSVVTWSLR